MKYATGGLVPVPTRPYVVGSSCCNLAPMLGASLIRVKLAGLNARVTELQQGVDSGRIGPRVLRARRRYILRDMDRVESIARKYGFKI